MNISKWQFSLNIGGAVTFGIGWYSGEPWKLFSLKVLCDDANNYLFMVFGITVLKFGAELFVTRED